MTFTFLNYKKLQHHVLQKRNKFLNISATFKRIFKESVLVTLTDYLSFGILFAITIALNKYYGTVELGVFTLIYTIAQITVMSLGSGFSGILRRDVSIDNSQATSYIQHILKIRGVIVMLSLALAISGCYFFIDDKPGFLYLLFLMIIAKGFDSGNETYYTTFQSLHAIQRFTILKSSNYLLLGALVLIACVFEFPVQRIYEIHVGVAVLFFLFNALLYRGGNPAVLTSKKNLNRYLLTETWPLLVNAVFFQLSARISILIIEALNGTRLQGLYSLGIIIIAGVTAFANSVSIVLFPYLTVTYNKNIQKLWPAVTKVTLSFLACSLLLTAAFNIALPYILEFVGDLPTEAPAVFRILSWGIIPVFLLSLTGYLFTITGHQRQGMYAAAVTLVINVAGFYLLSKFYGITGSAFAFVICQSISFVIMYAWVYYIIRKRSTH